MPAARGTRRVAVVEDHALFAEALEIALSLEGYAVHRVCPSEKIATGDQVVHEVVSAKPSTVLLDLDLGIVGDGATLVQPLSRAGIAVLIVTASLDRARWGECLRSGARAVIPKRTPLRSILDAIRLVDEGRSVITREQREELIGRFHAERADVAYLRRKLDLLTTRERQVLGDLMTGRAVRQIASDAVVSESTVRSQVKSILVKLEVSSQLAAVGLAHRVGWRPPEDSRRA
jgi:two-component system, NarL family, nitrate/nitrite response regulator NarL